MKGLGFLSQILSPPSKSNFGINLKITTILHFKTFNLLSNTEMIHRGALVNRAQIDQP